MFGIRKRHHARFCDILEFRIHCCMCVLHRWFFELLIKSLQCHKKECQSQKKGEEYHRFSLSHSRLYVRFQISICKVNFQRIGLNRRVSLSRLLRTEKPFKNIFFYAVARHEMMVSGYEKNVAEFLDISFFYGPWTLRTKSFLIDGGWWCCWVIQKL